jgi:hypothetical protein
MGLTLAQARDVVEDFLDDPTNARWSTSQIDVALAYALSSCMNDFVAAGGDRFDAVLTTTTTSAGVVDLSSYDPVKIQGVTVLIGSRYFKLTEVPYEERGIEDATVRNINIRYVRSFVLPTSSNTGHGIVSVSGTSAKTWLAFDHWICARAALYCATKDGESRPDLANIEKEARENAIFTTAIPKALPFPTQPHWFSNWLGYAWKQDEQKLVVVRKGWM